MTTQTERNVVTGAAKLLVGRKVVRVRYMEPTEAEEAGWSQRAAVLQFDDGTLLYAACDEAANDAGVLFVEKGTEDFCLGRLPT
jgi:hypothetical protein